MWTGNREKKYKWSLNIYFFKSLLSLIRNEVKTMRSFSLADWQGFKDDDV